MKKLFATFLLSLCTISLWGCKQQTPPSVEKTYPATVKGRVLTGTGDMLMAGIIITNSEGDMYRVNTSSLSGYELLLPEGTYDLIFTRGMEYGFVKKTIEVENYKTYYMDDVRLEHLYDGASKNWYIGELHQHSTFSDGKQSVEQVLLSNISNGLYFGFLTDHNTSAGLAEWQQGSQFIANYTTTYEPIHFVPLRGVEVTTDYGHFQSLGVGNVLEQADINPLKGDIPKEELILIAEEIKRSGALVSINHPFATSLLGFHFWEIVELYDVIEIWNGLYAPNYRENLQAKIKWFELLNAYRAGEIKFIPAMGGSDNHDISSAYKAAYANRTTQDGMYMDNYLLRGRYSGMPATCLYIEDDLSEENILKAIKDGHSYLTNGPRIVASIDGLSYGNEVLLNNRTTLNLDLELFSRDAVETINIYINGTIVETLDVSDTYLSFSQTVTLIGLQNNDWIVLEVIGENTSYAITNPIFIK